MTTITRQQLTNCIDPDELQNKDNAKRFNDMFLWIWGSIVTNDVISVTPEVRAQLNAMFHGWPITRKNITKLT